MFLCLSESLRRNFNEPKVVYTVYFWIYMYLVCHFVHVYYDAPITSQISVHLSRGGILRFHKGHALKEKRVKGWNLPRQQFLSSLWLQLSEQACVVPFMDMWEETRDDGRQPLTAISPGNFHTERKSFIKHTRQFQHRLLLSQLMFYIYIFFFYSSSFLAHNFCRHHKDVLAREYSVPMFSPHQAALQRRIF